ncbi:MAG: hypothetical protein GY720_02830, partial [bacterium]|nr:hypothetical protein [bacterium]
MTRDLRPVASAFFALATVLMLLAHSPASAGAAANSWPHEIVNGFATPDGSGFWLTYADGTVETHGSAQHLGDVSSLPLAGPVVGGAAHPSGNGY